MSRGGKIETCSGSRVEVWETFTFGKLSPEMAKELLEKFDFGREILIAAINRDDGGKAWRNEVVMECSPKVLTVQVVFQTACKKAGDTTPVILNACKNDAENSVLRPIETVLNANDVAGNVKKSAPPVSTPSAPTPPAPPAAAPAAPAQPAPAAQPPVVVPQGHRRP